MKEFPYTRYYPEIALMTWRPKGVFDDEFAEQVFEFIQFAEQSATAPFNRYTDFSGLSEIRMGVTQAFSIADRRSVIELPVKSAFFGDRPVTYGLARMIETLMEDASIHVRAFRERPSAAEWLGVPLEILTAET